MGVLASPRGKLTIGLAASTAVALIGVIVVLTAGPAVAKQFATLEILGGSVEVQRGGAAEFLPGANNQTLREGDTVRTGSDGRAEIEYFDGSVTRLDHDTTYRLKTLESNPDVPGSKVIEGDQEEGRTLSRVVALTGSESRFETDTPTATASVRGTSYVVRVFPDGTVEIWVTEGQVVLTLEDGTEVVIDEGQGASVDPDGNVDGPFQLTEEQLNDPWLLFNDCDLDGIENPGCEEEVLGDVIEPEEEEAGDDEGEEQDGPPPAAPTGTDEGEGDGGEGGTDPEPDPEEPQAEPDEPSDTRPITVTMSWTSGPANLDLHVLTPASEDEDGGEVWAGNPCLVRPDGNCWASSTGDAVVPGSETVTLAPAGSPTPGDWADGVYDIWVENMSCTDGSFEDSDASVTVSRGGVTIATYTVGGSAGDPTLETWGVGFLTINQKGGLATGSGAGFFGEECDDDELEKAKLGDRSRSIPPVTAVVVPPAAEAAQTVAGGNGDQDQDAADNDPPDDPSGGPPATDTTPPPEDPLPPPPEDVEPTPDPSPDPSPTPDPSPEPTPEPTQSEVGS